MTNEKDKLVILSKEFLITRLTIIMATEIRRDTR